MSFEEEADRQWVWAVGEERPEQDWILSDRDVWYPNPHFVGVRGPHPEDYPDEDYEQEDPMNPAYEYVAGTDCGYVGDNVYDDDCPF
jgi:hypothetical protein